MKNFILLSFFLIISSCKKEEKEIFDAPKLDDINKVIEAVILQDSLNVFKKDTSSESISLQLNKIDVKVMPSRKANELIAPEEPGNYVYVQQLLYSSKKHSAFFPKKDSTYLLYQNEVHRSLNIDLTFSKKLKTISFKESQADKYSSMPYYTLSIPIFSKDGNTAYVEGNHYFGDGGGGWALVLKRKNGQWKIVDIFRTWFS